MIKLITHVLVFALGAGAGVYWGVHHPSQAQNVADAEQARLNEVKQLGKTVNQTVNPTVQPVNP